MEVTEKRYASAVRKFLAFELAQGRKRLFPVYQALLKQALEAGFAQTPTALEKQAAARLAQVGLLVKNHVLNEQGFGRKAIATQFQLPCFEKFGVPDEFPADSFWLQRRLTGIEVLRFYQMPSAALEWVLSELEQQVVLFRKSDLKVHHWVAFNTRLVGQIWKISLYQELTLAADPPELAEMVRAFSKVKDLTKRQHIAKEKLGLAKMPNVFQMRHIRATCHYMRKSAGL